MNKLTLKALIAFGLFTAAAQAMASQQNPTLWEQQAIYLDTEVVPKLPIAKDSTLQNTYKFYNEVQKKTQGLDKYEPLPPFVKCESWDIPPDGLFQAPSGGCGKGYNFKEKGESAAPAAETPIIPEAPVTPPTESSAATQQGGGTPVAPPNNNPLENTGGTLQ